MKKILTTVLLLSVMTCTSFAATTSLKSAIKQDFQNMKTDVKTTAKDVKTSVKQDIQTTKTEVKTTTKDVKTAVKQDIANEKQAHENTAKAKKAEKIKMIDVKLNELNQEMTLVKNNKTITETERTLKIRTLQRQINLYQQQKKALQ